MRTAADRKEKEARDLLSSHGDQRKCDEQMKAFEPWSHFTIFFEFSHDFWSTFHDCFSMSLNFNPVLHIRRCPPIPALDPKLLSVGCSCGFHAEDEHVKQFCKDIQPALGNGSLSKLTHVKDVDPIQMAEEREEQNFRNQESFAKEDSWKGFDLKESED